MGALGRSLSDARLQREECQSIRTSKSLRTIIGFEPLQHYSSGKGVIGNSNTGRVEIEKAT